MTDVTPRFKEGRKPKPRRRGLARIGKKAQRDMDELAVARPIVMERCRGRCEVRWGPKCTGRVDALHHRERRSQGGSNDPENLIATCDACHIETHDAPAEAKARGLLA